MSTATLLTDLDQLGPTLCLVSGASVNLSYQDHPAGGFYAIDWIDEAGFFWVGRGDRPSEAYRTARRSERVSAERMAA